MEDFLQKIKQLDRRRIEYFLHSPNTSPEQYGREMREATNQLIQEIPLTVSTWGPGTRAYLVGKILNIRPDYEAKCEEQLEQSLRANSTREDAWLQLGQCVWKRADLEKAHSCFTQALDHYRSAKGLCLLSAAVRAKAGREQQPGETIRALNEALALCQEALQKQKDYPFAWYSLANTHLARFFAIQQIQERDLCLALEAFGNALHCPPSSSYKEDGIANKQLPFINPDLHLNYGQALYYRQDYAAALAQFRRALAVEPHFTQAQKQLEGARTFLRQLAEGIRRKGRLAQHRLTTLVDTFPKAAQKNGKTMQENLSLKELREQVSKALTIRCIGQMANEQQIPSTLICIDRTGQALALCVYNCSNNFGVLIGDMLTVQNGQLIEVKTKELDLFGEDLSQQNGTVPDYEKKVLEEEEEVLHLIRVTNPGRQLLKNGRPLAPSCCAFASLSIETQNSEQSSQNQTSSSPSTTTNISRQRRRQR